MNNQAYEREIDHYEQELDSLHVEIDRLRDELRVGNHLTAELTDKCRELEQKLRIEGNLHLSLERQAQEAEDAKSIALRGNAEAHYRLHQIESVLREMIQAMRDYQMDVDEPPPQKHRDMMHRAEAFCVNQ